MVSNQLLENFKGYINVWDAVVRYLQLWTPQPVNKQDQQVLNQALAVRTPLSQLVTYLASGQPVPSPNLDRIVYQLLLAFKQAPNIALHLTGLIANRCAGQMSNQTCSQTFRLSAKLQNYVYLLINNILVCGNLAGLKELTSHPGILSYANDLCVQEIRPEALKSKESLPANVASLKF